MKKLILLAAAAVSALFFTACRFDDPADIIPPDLNTPEVASLSLDQAKKIIKDAFVYAPAGRRPSVPDWEVIGNGVSSIRFRDHNRTGYVLVEVLYGPRVAIRFYSINKDAAQKFANAVWRIKKEYSK